MLSARNKFMCIILVMICMALCMPLYKICTCAYYITVGHSVDTECTKSTMNDDGSYAVDYTYTYDGEEYVYPMTLNKDIEVGTKDKGMVLDSKPNQLLEPEYAVRIDGVINLIYWVILMIILLRVARSAVEPCDHINSMSQWSALTTTLLIVMIAQVLCVSAGNEIKDMFTTYYHSATCEATITKVEEKGDVIHATIEYTLNDEDYVNNIKVTNNHKVGDVIPIIHQYNNETRPLWASFSIIAIPAFFIALFIACLAVGLRNIGALYIFFDINDNDVYIAMFIFTAHMFFMIFAGA